MSNDWKKVGKVSVDAGLIWIGDPCYTVAKDSSHVFKNWETFCDELYKRGPEEDGITDFDGIGIAVQSGYGDGQYNVYVKRDKKGTVLEAKIVFVEQDNESETDY
jgi:Protein of unknown function (DUF4241)